MAEMHITFFSLNLHGAQSENVLNSSPWFNRNDDQHCLPGGVFRVAECFGDEKKSLIRSFG
tara:strand:- start:91 stop:273 length:183 start_codon:yes stop_codon:yes gene_type:complete